MSREFFIPTNILLPFNVINNVRFAKILLWKHVNFAKICRIRYICFDYAIFVFEFSSDSSEMS